MIGPNVLRIVGITPLRSVSPHNSMLALPNSTLSCLRGPSCAARDPRAHGTLSPYAEEQESKKSGQIRGPLLDVVLLELRGEMAGLTLEPKLRRDDHLWFVPLAASLTEPALLHSEGSVVQHVPARRCGSHVCRLFLL